MIKLFSQFAQEGIARTIQYSMANIMDIVGLPTVGEIVETSKEELTAKNIEDIWNVSEEEKKVAYY